MFTAEVERHHHETPTLGGSDTSQLAQGGGVIEDVFEHVRADHCIECRIGQGHSRDVQAQFDIGLLEVRSYIPKAGAALEALPDTPFGREVKQ